MRARIEEPVELEAQAALREVQTELARGDVLDRVRFVDDEEVVWEEEAVAAGQRLGSSAEASSVKRSV